MRDVTRKMVYGLLVHHWAAIAAVWTLTSSYSSVLLLKVRLVSNSTNKRALALSSVQQMLHNYSHDISLSIQVRQSLTWLVTGTWRSSWGSVSRANWLFWETCCCCKWNSQEEIVINCHGCSAFNQGAVSTMDCFSNSRERYSILFLI